MGNQKAKESNENIWQRELAQQISKQRAKALVENHGIYYQYRLQIWGIFLNISIEQNEIIENYQHIKGAINFNEDEMLKRCISVDTKRMHNIPLLLLDEIQEIYKRVLYISFYRNNLSYIGGHHYLLIPFLIATISQIENIKPEDFHSSQKKITLYQSIEAQVFYLFDAFIKKNYDSFELRHDDQILNSYLLQKSKLKDKRIYNWLKRFGEQITTFYVYNLIFQSIKDEQVLLSLFDYIVINEENQQFINKFRIHFTLSQISHFKKQLFLPQYEDYGVLSDLSKLITDLEQSLNGQQVLLNLTKESYQDCLKHIN